MGLYDEPHFDNPCVLRRKKFVAELDSLSLGREVTAKLSSVDAYANTIRRTVVVNVVCYRCVSSYCLLTTGLGLCLFHNLFFSLVYV